MNWTPFRFLEEMTVDLKTWTLVKKEVQKVSLIPCLDLLGNSHLGFLLDIFLLTQNQPRRTIAFLKH